MQTVEISKELTTAISFLEELLNNKDGTAVIEAIKKYKQSSTANDTGLHNFNLK